jgi:hypothetical protein
MSPPALSADRDVVFVGGLHRSGTSVFARALATNPEIAGLLDTPARENEGQLLQDVYEPARAHGGAGRFAFNPAAHYTEQSRLVTEENARRILESWGRYADPSPRILLEKSPPNMIWMRFLQALFPRAKFVLLKRHPAVVSLRQRPFREEMPLVELLEHWVLAHDIMAADLPMIREARLVHYETFAAHPEQTLSDLAGFLGVEDRFDVAEVVDDRSEDPFRQWLIERDSLAPTDLERIAVGAHRHGYALDRLEPLDQGSTNDRS